MVARHFSHLVLDDFLPADLHDQMLAHVMNNRDLFVSSKIYADGSGGGGVDETRRRSWTYEAGLGPLKQPFKDAIGARFTELAEALGLSHFAILDMELELASHGNGCYFRPHIDTASGPTREKMKADRVISTVYYFHFHPKRFSGGELALLPLGRGEPTLIEPKDNRLLAFPSFALHEVRPVTCEDNFEHARFAINCWLRKAK